LGGHLYFLNAPAAVDTLSSIPYCSWLQYLLWREIKITNNPFTAWHDDKQTPNHGLHQNSAGPDKPDRLRGQQQPYLKCRREVYPDKALLVYKKPYSFTIGVTIIKKVN